VAVADFCQLLHEQILHVYAFEILELTSPTPPREQRRLPLEPADEHWPWS
jgi:hypothetical protein